MEVEVYIKYYYWQDSVYDIILLFLKFSTVLYKKTIWWTLKYFGVSLCIALLQFSIQLFLLNTKQHSIYSNPNCIGYGDIMLELDWGHDQMTLCWAKKFTEHKKYSISSYIKHYVISNNQNNNVKIIIFSCSYYLCCEPIWPVTICGM